MYGYTGKILRVDLTNRRTSTISTSDYKEWGGGHGIGSAIFWDLCEDKTIDGFDPRNVVTIMTSPLSGTMAPSAGSRCEVQGIGVQPHPVGWFTRSNFGGRFAAMLKFAGWDGIVIQGAADSPVWIKITDDKVSIEDANDLWGLDTYAAQQAIWAEMGAQRYGDWMQLGNSRSSGRTTQLPAVLTIGPAGETLSRIAALVHDGGSGAGQGGFGGIWGAKKLKAIGVWGTGSVSTADPEALAQARLWFVRNHQYNVDSPLRTAAGGMSGLAMGRSAGTHEPNRIYGCLSCPLPCRRRTQSGALNDSQCVDGQWYIVAANPDVKVRSVDLMQKYGLNAFDMIGIMPFLLVLLQMGMLGPGQAIDSSPLPLHQMGTLDFADALLKAMSNREGIGDDLAEGAVRAAERWGILEMALDQGLLQYPVWGYNWHWSLPGVEWTYGTLVGDRDINEHDFLFPLGTVFGPPSLMQQIPPQRLAEIMAEKTIPYTGDPFMFDYGDGPTGIYSEHKAKQIAWHRHYTRFWKQSAQYCDWVFPNFINAQASDFIGFTPEAEPWFYNAVTGDDLTFADGMEIGRRIWNLDRSIWVLQGRTRDMEKLAGFMYKPAGPGRSIYPQANPVYQDGQWTYDTLEDRMLIESGVEEWKTHYYTVEGWDTTTGWPTRSTLEGLGLGYVADELARHGKLGG